MRNFLHLKQKPEKQALSAVLRRLAGDLNRERITVGDLLSALGDRALGALMFIFAVPNVVPTPPGTSTVLGLPLIFLAAQVAFGRRPWLPGIVSRRAMSREDFYRLICRVAPWLERAEKLLKPRASVFATPPMEYVVGFVCLVLAVVLTLPIPLGNMLPGLAISLMALGLLERDGIWICAGFVATAASTALVSGVLYALFKAVVFFFDKVW